MATSQRHKRKIQQSQQSYLPPPPLHPSIHQQNHTSKSKKQPKPPKQNILPTQNTTELYEDIFGSPLHSIDKSINNSIDKYNKYNKYTNHNTSPSSLAVQYNDNDSFNDFKC